MILREKPYKIMKATGNKRWQPVVAIYKGTDTTYSYLCGILKKFQEIGLVEFSKDGRVKRVNLTKKGEELRNNLIQIWEGSNEKKT